MVQFDGQGQIVEVFLGNTFATDTDLEPIASLADLRKLDLSLTYVSDRGIEILQGLDKLEELITGGNKITEVGYNALRLLTVRIARRSAASRAESE